MIGVTLSSVDMVTAARKKLGTPLSNGLIHIGAIHSSQTFPTLFFANGPYPMTNAARTRALALSFKRQGFYNTYAALMRVVEKMEKE